MMSHPDTATVDRVVPERRRRRQYAPVNSYNLTS